MSGYMFSLYINYRKIEIVEEKVIYKRCIPRMSGCDLCHFGEGAQEARISQVGRRIRGRRTELRSNIRCGISVSSGSRFQAVLPVLNLGLCEILMILNMLDLLIHYDLDSRRLQIQDNWSPDEPTFSIRWNDLGSTSRNDFIPLGFESFSHQNARSGARSLFITVFSNVLVKAVSVLVWC